MVLQNEIGRQISFQRRDTGASDLRLPLDL